MTAVRASDGQRWDLLSGHADVVHRRAPVGYRVVRLQREGDANLVLARELRQVDRRGRRPLVPAAGDARAARQQGPALAVVTRAPDVEEVVGVLDVEFVQERQRGLGG